MSVESATYIGSLQATNPPSSDPTAQGDDHIRLVKSVLQSTFPNATRSFLFPAAFSFSSNTTLVVGHQNSVITCATTSAAFTLTLPSLVAGDAGWQIVVLKVTTDTNFVNIVPASGVIVSQAGSTALIRVGQVCRAATVTWNGVNWICSKDGGMIGETVCFDGPVPPGYLALDGSTFDPVAFCELNAMLGTNVLKDKRGRAEIGVDSGNVNMSTAGFGGAVSLGATKTGSTMALGSTNLPPYTPAGTITNGSITATGWTSNVFQSNNVVQIGGGGSYFGFNLVTVGATISQNASTFAGTAQGGVSTPFSVVPPTIVTNKIIRAC